ncbi:MAG TPA: hypothetical protein VG328_17600 [Stellaceae bacterium]|jgi:hypothetical protein|nr:hypothetical protein [Stellaceae bacterium]
MREGEKISGRIGKRHGFCSCSLRRIDFGSAFSACWSAVNGFKSFLSLASCRPAQGARILCRCRFGKFAAFEDILQVKRHVLPRHAEGISHLGLRCPEYVDPNLKFGPDAIARRVGEESVASRTILNCWTQTVLFSHDRGAPLRVGPDESTKGLIKRHFNVQETFVRLSLCDCHTIRTLIGDPNSDAVWKIVHALTLARFPTIVPKSELAERTIMVLFVDQWRVLSTIP